jgi:hypothetical protein
MTRATAPGRRIALAALTAFIVTVLRGVLAGEDL